MYCIYARIFYSKTEWIIIHCIFFLCIFKSVKDMIIIEYNKLFVVWCCWHDSAAVCRLWRSRTNNNNTPIKSGLLDKKNLECLVYLWGLRRWLDLWACCHLYFIIGLVWWCYAAVRMSLNMKLSPSEINLSIHKSIFVHYHHPQNSIKSIFISQIKSSRLAPGCRRIGNCKILVCEGMQPFNPYERLLYFWGISNQ